MFRAATLALFAMVWLWLARGIHADPGDLKNFAMRIGRDQAGGTPGPNRIREFGALGAALADMAARLTRSREQISEQNQALAEANIALEMRVAGGAHRRAVPGLYPGRRLDHARRRRGRRPARGIRGGPRGPRVAAVTPAMTLC